VSDLGGAKAVLVWQDMKERPSRGWERSEMMHVIEASNGFTLCIVANLIVIPILWLI
jgi:hypothetical protein